MKLNRGALIIIEGLDRTGKSTQSKKLVENLNKKQLVCEYMNFPNRSTEIGQVINSYLKSQKDLPDETIHLLFSANRWENARNIVKTLEKGVSIVIDRYCYSGVAFTAAKGYDLDWCKTADVGLPKPDKVFFLTMPLENIQERKGYGEERYEVATFQKNVAEMYTKLRDNTWDIIDASRSIEKIEEELLSKSVQVLESIKDQPVGKIWVDRFEPFEIKN